MVQFRDVVGLICSRFVEDLYDKYVCFVFNWCRNVVLFYSICFFDYFRFEVQIGYECCIESYIVSSIYLCIKLLSNRLQISIVNFFGQYFCFFFVDDLLFDLVFDICYCRQASSLMGMKINYYIFVGIVVYWVLIVIKFRGNFIYICVEGLVNDVVVCLFIVQFIDGEGIVCQISGSFYIQFMGSSVFLQCFQVVVFIDKGQDVCFNIFLCFFQWNDRFFQVGYFYMGCSGSVVVQYFNQVLVIRSLYFVQFVNIVSNEENFVEFRYELIRSYVFVFIIIGSIVWVLIEFDCQRIEVCLIGFQQVLQVVDGFFS